MNVTCMYGKGVCWQPCLCSCIVYTLQTGAASLAFILPSSMTAAVMTTVASANMMPLHQQHARALISWPAAAGATRERVPVSVLLLSE